MIFSVSVSLWMLAANYNQWSLHHCYNKRKSLWGHFGGRVSWEKRVRSFLRAWPISYYENITIAIAWSKIWIKEGRMNQCCLVWQMSYRTEYRTDQSFYFLWWRQAVRHCKWIKLNYKMRLFYPFNILMFLFMKPSTVYCGKVKQVIPEVNILRQNQPH